MIEKLKRDSIDIGLRSPVSQKHFSQNVLQYLYRRTRLLTLPSFSVGSILRGTFCLILCRTGIRFCVQNNSQTYREYFKPSGSEVFFYSQGNALGHLL